MYKVLIVSPFFWPFAGVGAERMGSLARFLARLNKYDLFILKNNNNSYGDYVVSSEKVINNVKYINADNRGSFYKDYCEYKSVVELTLEKYEFNCIIISVGPYYTFPLVKLIKKIQDNVPIILDIRDLWAHEGSFLEDKSFFNRIKLQIKNIFQKSAIKNADIITMADDNGKFIIGNIYGEKMKEKVFTIMNGFDEERVNELEKGKSLERSRSFNLCIFGKFAEYLDDNQVRIIAEVLKLYQEDIMITQVGHKEERLEKNLNFNNVKYFNTGYLSYEEGINYLKNNATAFFLSNDLKVGNGTKIYDYIFCDKPIIYFGEKNTGLSIFLDNFRNSFVCSNGKELIDAIRMIKEDKIETLEPKDDDIFKYSRKRQNIKFEKIIQDCCLEDI